LEYARRRIGAFLEEIKHVSESEFPYPDSEAALSQLRELFQRKYARLLQLDERSNLSVVTRECTLALGWLVRYLPRLGFILRSTNVRNAFELYGPIFRLAGKILEPNTILSKRKTRLLLSSEWDYSPLIFRDDPELPNFVLIGLPAHESANPLLIPLVGHELGHSFWSKNELRRVFAPRVATAIVTIISRQDRWSRYQSLFPQPSLTSGQLFTNRDAVQTWQQSLLWALKQAEETFCDLLGLKLFGTSYLNSFAYLLSPKLPFGRNMSYPSLTVRTRNQVKASHEYGITIPTNYEANFRQDNLPSLTPTDTFRLSLADESLQVVLPELINKVREIVDTTPLKPPEADGTAKAKARMEGLVPAEDCGCLAEILNAAWQIYDTYPKTWDSLPRVKDNKEKILKELVLKSIEVFEIQTIQTRSDSP
jgi:hypothetical protein